MRDLNAAELARITKRHQYYPDGTGTGDTWCLTCNEVWPCDAARLLQELERKVSP